jgi:thioredoxin 1
MLSISGRVKSSLGNPSDSEYNKKPDLKRIKGGFIMAIQVTDATFKKEVLEAEGTVLVDFWAEWCGPCKMIAPFIDEISKENQGKLKVCKVNVDEGGQTASSYGVMSIPTLMVFKNGNVLEKFTGAMPKNDIMSRVAPYL